MNFTISKKDWLAGEKKLFTSDTPVKLIGIPVLGLLIPNAFGLIDNAQSSPMRLVLGYLYSIVVSFIIWEGNVRLMIFLKNKMKIANKHYYKSIAVLLTGVAIYTFISSSLCYVLWGYLQGRNIHAAAIATTKMVVAVSVFIATLYETFFLSQEHADVLSRAEQLNIAKTHAELVALKNQIDPHFIFNSLNTLSHLISTNPKSAKLYNDTLAKMYQYILINREKNFVFVRDEIEFASNYFYLLKIRFGGSINMVIEISDTEAQDNLLLPISLQILIENVIKHNELRKDSPLTIYICVSPGFIVVYNEIRTKQYHGDSSSIGLANLDNRYKLLTGENIIVETIDNQFTVKLPVLNIN
jgi:sensor histidine kinase YesM